MDDSSDDALFAEMLALLGDDSPQQPQQQSMESVANVAETVGVVPTTTTSTTNKKPGQGIGSAARRKIAIDVLRIEQQQLCAQLDRLRGGATHAIAPFHSAKERALAERHRRRRAEQECDTLRRAVLQQMEFLRGLRGAVAAGPGTGLGLNLCHYLHNFTRLPRDHTARQREYRALSRTDRLDAAFDLLSHEIGAISVVDAHLETDYQRESDDACAASTLSVFTMDCGDVGAVLRAACVANRDILLHSRPFQNIGLHGEIVDADALSHHNMQYRATSVHKRSDEADDFSIESLEVSMFRLTSDAAVMLWDFVDDDELAPLGATPDISRQSLGACLIRSEKCPDGIQRVVYRELSMRRYVYRGDAPTLPLSVERYFASKRSSVGPNELVYRDLMAHEIAQEEAMLHSVVV